MMTTAGSILLREYIHIQSFFLEEVGNAEKEVGNAEKEVEVGNTEKEVGN